VEEHPKEEVDPPEKNKVELEPPGREADSQGNYKGEI
jgi:hypothetical protein